MNVFVLCTGRCGSMTFSKACAHMTNYTAGHETRIGLISERMKYPPNHIEADNMLSWFIGWLDELYGDNAFYVHLFRDRAETTKSWSERFNKRKGLMDACENYFMFQTHIIKSESICRNEIAQDFVDAVTKNINLFLRDKTKKITIDIDDPKQKFYEFWDEIKAEGDLNMALSEFDIRHNE